MKTRKPKAKVGIDIDRVMVLMHQMLPMEGVNTSWEGAFQHLGDSVFMLSTPFADKDDGGMLVIDRHARSWAKTEMQCAFSLAHIIMLDAPPPWTALACRAFEKDGRVDLYYGVWPNKKKRLARKRRAGK
jgi:hypothetical protein